MESEAIQPKSTISFKKHYLEKIFSKIQLPHKRRAFIIAVGFYIIFLLSALATDWITVSNSVLHPWQLSLSVTIFLGLWLGDIAFRDVKVWLAHARNLIDESDYSDLEYSTLNRLGSRWSFLFALPFIIPGFYIALRIAKEAPSDLFPFSGYSPAFIFTIVIELCLIMFHLLGASGFWVIYVFTKSSQKLLAIKSVSDNLVDDDSLLPLSEIVTKLCVYLLLIVGSAMPGIAYIGFRVEGISQWVVVLFGVAFPTIALIMSFWFPIYFLHKILQKTKERRLTQINTQITFCEERLNISLSDFSSRQDLKDEEIIRLMGLVQYLYHYRKDVKAQSTWPFKISSLIKLIGSSFITISAFFIEEIIGWFVVSKVAS